MPRDPPVTIAISPASDAVDGSTEIGSLYPS
jgi:hypothetical protein